jgi:hypothetical protein
MDLAVFRPHELRVVLGTLRSIDHAPSPPQEHFIEVLARMHGARVDTRSLPCPTAAETAAAIEDPHRRKRLLQLATVMTMIDGQVQRGPAMRVVGLARALGVDEEAVGTLAKLAARHETMARVDLLRRVMGRFIGEAWREERWSGVGRVLAPFSGSEDAATAARYHALSALPAGSFGRVFWEHNSSRGFAFPGERGGIPERMLFHDLGHVLAGYDTDPRGEIQQAAFQSGYVRKDGFAFLFFGIVQFHLGVKITPIAAPELGYFDVDRVMTALARGACCRVDLSDHWDFWPWLSRPLDEVRADLRIPPLDS